MSAAECAALISRSNSIVAVTGAGISTAAGIPDFRGPQGLYVTRRYDPVKVFEITSFLREPGFFYDFSRDFIARTKAIVPTLTHRFLAELELRGRLAAVITQNIDVLHQQAGSRTVLELHGSYAKAVCTVCGSSYADLSRAWWDAAMRTSRQPPIVFCPSCDGLLKPDIVFFGEQVKNYGDAENMVAACDLLLVLGSSLEIAPASRLPHATRAPTVIVSKGDVALIPTAQRYFVAADVDVFFSAVSACLQ